MKRKLSAKTILLYVTFVALSVTSFVALDGAVSFGLYVGAMYSANPVIASVIYLAASVVYGWGSLLQAGVRVGVMLLCWGIHLLAKRKIGKLNLLLYLVLANVFYCVYGFTDYFDFFDKLLYVACGIAFAYVTIYAFRAVFVRGLAYRPALDETVCIALFTVVSSYCFSSLSFWGFELIYLIAPFIILFCAVCFGSNVSLVAAVLFGIGNVLSCGAYEFCVFSVVSALVAVTVVKVNRYLAALSVVAVDVLMTYFLELHGASGMFAFAPTFASALIFAVIPSSVYNYVRDYSCGTADRYLGKSVAKKIGDNVSRRLYRLSDIFLSMKNAFFTMSVGRVSDEEAEISIVKQCSETVCRDCEFRSKCWRQELVQTEQSLLKLSGCAVKRGKCSILDVPQTLSVKCNRVSAVLSEVNAQAQTYREYVDRTEQADNGKTLLGEQMGGVSDLLMQLASDCKNRTYYKSDKEKELVERLVFHNIMCVGATVVEQSGKLTVAVTVAKKDVDNAVIEKVVSALVKQNMAVDKVENTESISWLNVYLSVKPRFDVVFGVSSVTKEGSEVSGDTHSVIKTDNGKCIVALCDGMGSGDKAEKMSATSISLVESFYRAGFDSDVILSCVNKLLTGSGNEVFCAVDIAVLDAFDGQTDFIKLGASTGLVKCGDKVEIVSGSSLPLGVLEEMKPSITKKALSSGDVFVLVSDGVADCFKDPNALAGIFANVSLNVPQSIAEVILSKAVKLCNNKPHDDMTVLVAKLV
ncbi:MAG: SpoIIE family protein phosphatase [Corallococcus sp.]|nr:SpoIIE family protein phosphatase [Corallococcus sp.]